MEFIHACLFGLGGMLVGWIGLAALMITLEGPGLHDGGTGMTAIFVIGPIGGFFGFIAGIWLFIRIMKRGQPQ
jgi:hypothetical protein